MKQFVFLDAQQYPDQDMHQEKEILSKAGYDVKICKCKTDEEVIEAAKDAETIGVVYHKIGDSILDQLPKVKCVSRYGIGYDNLDIDSLTRHGVFACNLPTYCLDDVAEIALAFILDLARKVTFYDRDCRKGNWNVGLGYTPHRMNYYTVGLCGFGNIARHLWAYLKPFGVKGIAYDAYLPDSVFEENGVKKVSFDELLAQSDIVSVHVPNTPETWHMFDQDAFAKMKEGSMLINTARGPVVSNEALAEAVKSGKLAAAALDVNEDEPIHDTNHILYEAGNVIVLPHTAYNTFEAADTMHIEVGEISVAAMNGTLTTDPEMALHIVREQRPYIDQILEMQKSR